MRDQFSLSMLIEPLFLQIKHRLRVHVRVQCCVRLQLFICRYSVWQPFQLKTFVHLQTDLTNDAVYGPGG